MDQSNKLNLTAPVYRYFEFVSINDKNSCIYLNVLFVKKVIKNRKINKAYHVKFPNTCLKRHHLNEYSEIKN